MYIFEATDRVNDVTIRDSASDDEVSVAILGTLYVGSDHWNEGIGTALLNEFEAFCRQHGYDTISSGCFPRTRSACRFIINTGTQC